MRFVVLVAAAITAACCAAPAQAKLYTISISATLTGLTQTYDCPTPDRCVATFSYEPFLVERNGLIINLEEGANTLDFYDPGRRESFMGTILNNKGSFSGINLTYQFDGCFPAPRTGCVGRNGTAATFYVGGGVPEPATWLTLILGFMAVGGALRSARLPARTSAPRARPT